MLEDNYMKEKIYNLLKVLIQILYFILLIIGYFYILEKFQFRTWLELEPNDYYSRFFCSIIVIWLIERIAYFLSVIFHELGHLIFGLIAKLKFKKFTIFMLSISYKIRRLLWLRHLSEYWARRMLRFSLWVLRARWR